ncbi:hypothetical protein [Priestia filamentosa]|nr:hypothetical protein [Priestia filamentosa]SMF75068.1 hypothetical protein SAMN06296056_11716 [Priestia filamentosa]
MTETAPGFKRLNTDILEELFNGFATVCAPRKNNVQLDKLAMGLF